ncbi:MAG: proline racemase family protein [Kangiellaceae bacterium]|nr:proline racemase family protein [Kangiellaceae bacterium]MCW9015853.1 proline racemase family protein [Kangiellaceae bacterium]
MSFFERYSANKEYRLPDGALELTAIDMHTGGEPLRVVTSGYPQIEAKSLLEFRRVLKQDYDHFRTALMFEPRGHADMYGCLLLKPFHPEADCSVIFMHNEGYSTMCGHAVIGIMTLAVEMGWVEVINDHARLNIEAPCGLIKAQAEITNGKVKASFECVPSFVTVLDAKVFVTSIGKEIRYDLAYGGAFYAYVDAAQLELDVTSENYARIIELGREIKQAVVETSKHISHPLEGDLSFLYGTIFIDGPVSDGCQSRNVCVFADGEVDRSPTGSGVSGRMAIHYAKGELRVGEGMRIESVIGSSFYAEVTSTLQYGGHQAVIPKVSGDAYVCGTNRFIINPDDNLKHGFLLR